MSEDYFCHLAYALIVNTKINEKKLFRFTSERYLVLQL